MHYESLCARTDEGTESLDYLISTNVHSVHLGGDNQHRMVNEQQHYNKLNNE